MGFEVTYTCHPRKEEGGYDMEKKEEKNVKVGKPFDEVPLENLAAAIMGQMARRDVWVVDVKIVELARREVAFKECKDGMGITIKNRRFSFNEAAQMVAEDVVEGCPVQQQGLQPHEMVNIAPQSQTAAVQPHQSNYVDDLYSNPNKPVPVQRNNALPPVNQKKVMYKVAFDPLQWAAEARRLKLKFTQDKEYPVHQVVPHPLGRLDLQNIIVTDDTGKAVKVDEKYFTSVGTGLLADAQLGFSGSSQKGVRKPKLAFEDEMYIDAPDPNAGRNIPEGIPVDDGNIPMDLMAVPDIRAPRR